MSTVINVVLTATLVAALPSRADGQERRERRPDQSASASARTAVAVSIPDVPRDPARPFVGVWEGTFHPEGRKEEATPFTVVIEYLNGTYSGYSFIGPTAGGGRPIGSPAEHERGFGWENANMGTGMLVYRATLAGENAIEGTMTLRGGNWEPPPSSFSLRRRGPPR
jgi:hypothetical protein